MLSFRQILAAVPVEQRFEGLRSQVAEPLREPVPLDLEALSFVSGGKSADSIPNGGW